ncbi:hypothetical protein [Aquisalimonas asiatica]|uniref:Uncharacterized protein n=1 Tax=Aquisalimonas asiatica TaxID=406100 RepID=A0A1H8VB42_9GAMM|nr:hypothetical protein [Aquisalimonas asiatica]SEP12533.1 hypothetical protein SAMN04488052_11116 [Aquisalimonas asiatica]
MQDEQRTIDTAAQAVVDLGNQLAERDQEADMGDIADGLLSGAVHYWLYTRQPCEDPRCPDCAQLRTAEWRMQLLQQLVEEMARSSDYFESPGDMTPGNA